VDNGVQDSSTVSLVQIEVETVEQGILALDTQKGPGHDGIVLVVKTPFAVVFNLSMLSVVFSCVRKESYVIALLKSGEKRNITSYRGISILSAFPKLFEKLVL
jgi:hypothetical protein